MSGMKSKLYRFAPDSYTKVLEDVMFYKDNGEVLWNSALTTIMSFLSGTTLLVAWYFLKISLLIPLIVVIPLLILLVNYFIQYKKMRNRTDKIEKYIPDFLHLIAANIRSGMTPFQALKFSARDEFGPLKKEIDYATTLSLGEISFSESLLRIKDRVRSEMFDRVIELLISSIRSGGKLSKVMLGVSDDISSTNDLRKSLESETKSYSMLIIFLVVIGTPLLLAISLNFLSMITSLSSQVGSSQLAFFSGEILVTTEFVRNLSLVVLGMSTLSASVLIGIIKTGRMRDGVFYYPLLLTISIVLFFALEEGVKFIIPAL